MVIGNAYGKCNEKVIKTAANPGLIVLTAEKKNLNIDIRVSRVVFNKLATWRNIITHQHRENMIGLRWVFDGYLT